MANAVDIERVSLLLYLAPKQPWKSDTFAISIVVTPTKTYDTRNPIFD